MDYYVDIERSQRLANQGKEFIAKQQCYRNIWNLFSLRDHTLVDPTWNIAYGVTQVHSSTVYIAHAFFFDPTSQKVIDPTPPNSADGKYLLAILMTQDEYLQSALEYKTIDLEGNKFIWSGFRRFLESEENEADLVLWHGGSFINPRLVKHP